MKSPPTLRILFFTHSLLFGLVQFSLAQPPLKTLMEVEYINSNFGLGTGMIGLGDINNDGKADFAVSAASVGKTFIYFGGKGVLDSTVDVKIRGGGGMALGDLNGDGRMDLVVAGPNQEETLYVYFGKTPTPLAIDTVPDVIIPRESSGGGETGFGKSFAIGDLNHDGFDDLVVGAYYFGPDQGRVYLYYGRINFKNTPDAIAEGDAVRYLYGRYIKIADINGDGIKDLAIGSDRRKYVDSIWVNDGLLDIYYGKSGWQFTKNGYNQRFDIANTGYQSIYSFGLVDVNADGKADISITQGESAYFFYGRSDSVRHTPDFILANPDTSFYTGFGSAAYPIGDINKDGKEDYAMRLGPGGPGACIAVYLGNTNPQRKPVADRCRGGNDPFNIIVPLGDINGDGVNDFGSVAFDLFSNDGSFIIFSGDSNYVMPVSNKHVEPPQDLDLKQNFPNPFNPSTTIEYKLSTKGHVVIMIYDAVGREVKTLLSQNQEGGSYKTVWDGTDSRGERVSSGLYFYQLQINNNTVTKKAVHIK